MPGLKVLSVVAAITALMLLAACSGNADSTAYNDKSSDNLVVSNPVWIGKPLDDKANTEQKVVFAEADMSATGVLHTPDGDYDWTRNYSLGPDGKLKSVVEYYPGGESPSYERTYMRDSNGTITEVDMKWEDGGGTHLGLIQPNNEQRFTYHDNGQIKTFSTFVKAINVDEKDWIHEFGFNEQGWPISDLQYEVGSDGSKVSTERDLQITYEGDAERPSCCRVSGVISTSKQIETKCNFEYDKDGHLIEVVGDNGKSETYAWEESTYQDGKVEDMEIASDAHLLATQHNVNGYAFEKYYINGRKAD